MQVQLSKHHGLGNDFLVYDLAQGTPPLPWPQLAVQWCHRRTGVGADGLLLLNRNSPTDLSMVLYNADGSRAEMSGNGIRCLVQAAHLETLASSGTWYNVSTDTGVRVVEVTSDWDGETLQLSVDMGIVEKIDAPLQWDVLQCDPIRPVHHVSLGNPHSVVGVDNVRTVDLLSLGEKVPLINLEIIEPGPEPHGITMRVHERGAGITSACGTGACAAADAALKWGFVSQDTHEVVVHMDGGDARVRISSDRQATLIGPAVYIGVVTVRCE